MSIAKCYHLRTPTLKHTSRQKYSNAVHTNFAIKNHTVIENTRHKRSFPSTDHPKDVWEGVAITMNVWEGATITMDVWKGAAITKDVWKGAAITKECLGRGSHY